MNSQSIIDWKLQQMKEGLDEPMPKEMQQWLQQHGELEQELAFIESFYQADFEPQMPPASMDAGFYQKLAEAQGASANNIPVQHSPVSRDGWYARLQAWLAPRPIMHAAAFGLVFTLGFSSHYLADQKTQIAVPSGELAGLKQEVSSLTSVVALALLRHPVASERLSGVAYSRQANFSDPALASAVFDLLESDSSVSVRLAVIDSLTALPDFSDYEPRLLQLITQETNPMVQLELCQLLIGRGSQAARNTLLKQQTQQHLHPDVMEFIHQVEAVSVI